MKKHLIQIAPYIVIILMLIYIGECTRQEQPVTIVNTIDTVTVTDTVYIEGKIVYNPIPYEVVDTFIVSPKVDTAKILTEYVLLRKYNLPITNDSNSKISVQANVQFNRISDYTFTAEIYPKTTIITQNHTIIPPTKNKLIIGAVLASNGQNLGFIPTVGLKTKKESVFTVGYDVLNGNLNAGYLMPIGKKSK